MKKPILALTALTVALSVLALVPTAPVSNRIKLVWSYPPSELSTNLTFVVVHTTNASLALTNWPVLTTVAGTNTSVVLTVVPGFHAYALFASNFWGVSRPSEVVQTPALPLNDVPVSVQLEP
jgi:hypothetical protein